MTVAVHEQQNGLALDQTQEYWNDQQLAALQHMGVERASGGDLAVFYHVCKRTGLDPFARQISMIGRNVKNDKTNQWETRYTIQTGIDGYRLVADRADRRDGTIREYEDTLWCDRDGNWRDVWLGAGAPVAAKVVVLRNGKRFPATALFSEFVQTKKDGNPNAMWSRMPANQLAKCAEALALRKAYPQDLSGVYTDDEMGQADREPAPVVQAQQTSAADRMRSALGAEPQPASLDPRSDLGKAMFASFNEAGVSDRDARLRYVSDVVGRDVTSSKDMTEDDARTVLRALDADLHAAEQQQTFENLPGGAA